MIYKSQLISDVTISAEKFAPVTSVGINLLTYVLAPTGFRVLKYGKIPEINNSTLYLYPLVIIFKNKVIELGDIENSASESIFEYNLPTDNSLQYRYYLGINEDYNQDTQSYEYNVVLSDNPSDLDFVIVIVENGKIRDRQMSWFEINRFIGSLYDFLVMTSTINHGNTAVYIGGESLDGNTFYSEAIVIDMSNASNVNTISNFITFNISRGAGISNSTNNTGLILGGKNNSTNSVVNTIYKLDFSSLNDLVSLFGTIKYKTYENTGTSNGELNDGFHIYGDLGLSLMTFDEMIKMNIMPSFMIEHVDFVNFVTTNEFGSYSPIAFGLKATSNQTFNDAVIIGGYNNNMGTLSVAQYFRMDTKSNATEFGFLSEAKTNTAVCSNGTKSTALILGGLKVGMNLSSMSNSVEVLDITTRNSCSLFRELDDGILTEMTSNAEGDIGFVISGIYGINPLTKIQQITISNPVKISDFAELSTPKLYGIECNNG